MAMMAMIVKILELRQTVKKIHEVKDREMLEKNSLFWWDI